MGSENDLKTERDRFVAFTFCWSDIILELDPDFNIAFAGGAIGAITGKKDDALIGQPITDIIAESDHGLFLQVASNTDEQNRIEAVSVRLNGRAGPTPPIEMMGYRVKDLKNHLFLGFRLGDNFGRATNLKKDEDSGLYDEDSFLEAAQATIQSNAMKGEQVEMTMLDMEQLQAIANGLGNEDAGHLMTSVGSYLKSSSIGGDTAGRISDNKFGIVHKTGLKVDELSDEISKMASSASGDDVTLEIKSATMDVDAENITEEDLANGLAYTINQFKHARGKDFSMDTLSRNMSELVTEAHDKISTFKQVVADREFFIAFQPIIGARDGKIHHYECLARFRGEQSGKSPYEYIVFAEETGLIPEFDFAMAQAALQWLGQQAKGKNYKLAVNVSGYSVGDRGYIKKLMNLLKNNAWAKGALMFEITESARLESLRDANIFIQNLRKMGYKVCLDDFGAGAASFQYLSTLDVDIVKLDGSAIRNARKAPKGRSFLIALGNLCRDLKVDTIAEMIDDPEGLVFVRECGIQQVQGYLFGKPSPDINSFDPLPKLELFSKKAQSRSAASVSVMTRR
ncbi:putative diguanylate phosphodiesterase (EAL domain) [Candidatus Terasakiella magnetica]|uniref:Putative diguanylate phosphodiesterase (EAL domain) n=1 Tax=Candidatus Terasakiella magnetica TaxID=1867952 RepID=A0A1C3RIY9_9PROT|nr:EAL domain-containing protein [Candidatus Terasakiella magnetica]SCA57227.1 putative diguanylate phosphodiesterase (EAL domain) [Candidatus Terasakiella magnetica]